MSALDSVLAPDRLVDLTQPLGPATVLWPDSRPFEAEVVVDHDTHGAYARNIALPEHAGTHLDAPAHFAREGAATHELPIGVLVRPAVRLDVREVVGDNAEATIGAADIETIEERDGEVPVDSAVLVHTGWDRFAQSSGHYGGDAPPSFPGIGPDAAQLLVDRGVVGIGIDTMGIDPGNADGFPAHRVTMPAGLWHLEGLVGLERVPSRGAWLIAAALPISDGSGSPARVFAVLPPPS